MMRRLIIAAATCVVIAIAGSSAVHATDVVDCTGLPKDQCSLVTENKLDYTSSDNIIWKIVQFLFVALGGIAVIMIIVGGIQYATSQGDSGALQKAKNTILYAIIGLVVAIAATTIVSFIINNVAK